jgi:hypothetical protein
MVPSPPGAFPLLDLTNAIIVRAAFTRTNAQEHIADGHGRCDDEKYDKQGRPQTPLASAKLAA